MIAQDPKQLIDIGEIGNASTGDILYEGGKKLNENLNALYNTFGDQRLFVNDSGDKVQKLHATGYYQKLSVVDWQAQIPLGSLCDVDASTGVITARLAKGKLGEGMVFINSNGSISPTNYFEIQAFDSFVSVPSGNLKITQPFCKVTVWCVSSEGGISKWDYSIESMFGNKHIPLDKTFTLSSAQREIQIAPVNTYQTIKLFLTCASTDGLKVKTSEVMLYIDSKASKVYSTEYAVIRKGNVNEDDEIYSINYIFDNNGFISAVASSTTQNMQLAIKVVSTQSFGVPV
ncbi:baseplate wedge tail fiber connector [Edwardsiella phage PEi26]|uniref:Baseplate wedge tail fiber connector n=1 Tax=Edwardsiella phage PEi26 TaxID=1608311 RepID=A0A0B6VRK5_9CAUD|nr:baseplate wedge tail fiber connector [Edwardsiella phage PEi26]